MKRRILIIATLVLCSSSNALACGLESTFRSYLDSRFWQPLIKYEDMLGKEFFNNQNKTCHEYAGIGSEETDRPIVGQIRAAYQTEDFDLGRNLIKEAHSQQLTDGERDEINLVDIKMDMMDARSMGDSALLESASERFSAYLKNTADPYRASETRGWLAHIHYLKDEYSSAAKIYLDELANPESVFSRQNLTMSLMLMFPYNGSAARLHDHLDEYFDTPAHALFVVNLVTNPIYKCIVLPKPAAWLRRRRRKGSWACISRPAERRISCNAAFLYEAAANGCRDAEKSSEASSPLYMPWPYDGWLFDLAYLLDIELTDAELEDYLVGHVQDRVEAVSAYYSRPRNSVEMVKYALAVRYARKEQYEKAASIFENIDARPRSARMKKLVGLYADAVNPLMEKVENLTARYTYASFLAANSTGIFFNDMLWHGYQTWSFINTEGEPHGYRYDFHGKGLTLEERDSFIKKERRVRDDQEERWRAYRIIAGIVEEAGPSDLGVRAAKKALICLGKINIERFGRKDEIERGQAELIRWLRKHGNFRGIATKKKCG